MSNFSSKFRPRAKPANAPRGDVVTDSTLIVPMARRTTNLDQRGWNALSTECPDAARDRHRCSERRRPKSRVGRVAAERLSTGCNRETAREGRYEFPVEGAER